MSISSTRRLRRGLAGWRGVWCLALMAAAVGVPSSYAGVLGQDQAPIAAEQPRVVFTIESAQITESSSLVISTRHPDLAYTSNDSGDSATVYVLDKRSGALIGQTSLAGVEANDIEALAAGADGSLVVADIGNNHGDRAQVMIYRIDQPRRGSHSVIPESVSVTYADGQHDAESILYDAEAGRVFVASKDFEGARIFRSPPDVFASPEAELRPIADVEAPGLATDATFVPGRELVVIRTYFAAVVYRYPSWQQLDSIELPVQRQGESVAAPPDGTTLWVGSEGRNSQVLAVDLPELAGEIPTVRPPGSEGGGAGVDRTSSADEAQTDDQDRLTSLARLVLLIAIPVLMLLGLVGAVAWRRHQN